MTSGSLDAQERAELEAAEKGIRLTRPADYKREYSTLNSWTPERLAQESQETLAYLQQNEEKHERIRQATVEYLYRNALGERVTQQQIANEFSIGKREMRWRLQRLRGYSERRAQRREERERAKRERRKKMQFFILDERTHTPIPVDHPTAAAWWGNSNMTIAEDEVGPYTVSTRAIPWFEHHEDNPMEEPPIIFMTEVDINHREWCYFAWEKALEGHKKVVEFTRLVDEEINYLAAEMMVWGFSSSNVYEDDVEFSEEDEVEIADFPQ